MTITELIAEANRLTRNGTVDPLWTQDEWLVFLNWAEREACRRSKLIWDRATADLAVYTLSVDAGWTDLSDKVVRVERVTFGGKALIFLPVEDMDSMFPGWEAATTGTPDFITRTGRSLRCYPGNKTAGDLVLYATRLPINDLTDADMDNTSPEIPDEYHPQLVHGMLHKAYLKNDAETYNKGASDIHLAEFEKAFGGPVPAHKVWMPGEEIVTDPKIPAAGA